MRIALEDYDASWPRSFDRVRERLISALGDLALLVEHVGSTSVPGLCAKPVIDVVLVVTSSADEDAYAHRLVHEGFRFHVREPGWYDHRLFKLDEPPSNIHVLSAGCPEIRRMLLFRDLLRRDGGARRTYAKVKRALAELEWAGVQEYADAKTDVVEELLEAAGAAPRRGDPSASDTDRD